MIFYSGFSLEDDDVFFKEYLIDSPYCVCGFSYGAIQAFEYVRHTNQRVDTLQLFSPAFFQEKEALFKRMQLLGFKKDENAYISQFIDSCFAPYPRKNIPINNGSYDELKELLEYEWDRKELQRLHHKGLNIEIYVGSDDAIIDAQHVKQFFQPFSTVFYFNHANHFLQQQ